MAVRDPLWADRKARVLSALEDQLGHTFKNPKLLKRALSHASMGPAKSNERLEFLGDRVLGLIVAEKLHAEHPDADEGKLALMFNAAVRREACVRAGEAAGLADHLVVAAGDTISGARAKAAMLAGACEAVIAALYLDGGYEAAKNFVLRYWEAHFSGQAEELRDAKTALQEWAQSGALKKKAAPVYTVKGRTGPDHAPHFTVEVSMPGVTPQTGEGATKRDAEQAAAAAMLKSVGQRS